MKRMIFMGTPELAATVLQALIDEKYNIIAAVTQPDRPKGRGNTVTCSPVKELCTQYGIPVLQPERARNPEFIEEIRKLTPDVIVVAAYGKILPNEILTLPKYGCINVHTSLLPDYKGAAPIQWVILNGEKKTGVTIMYMNEGCDTGDIISAKEVEILPEDTGESLTKRLACEGSKLLTETLCELKEGRAGRQPQDPNKGRYFSVIEKTLGCLDFTRPAEELERYIRGLNPWPCAYTYLDGKMLKLWKANVMQEQSSEAEKLLHTVPGTIISAENKNLQIQTGDGILILTKLQLEGKKKMNAEEFLRGYTIKPGTILKRER